MSLATPMTVACPACGHRFTEEVQQAVDAQKEPQLKDLLVQERLNVAACPNCQNQVMVNSPVVYHDPGRSMLAVYVPMGMGRSDTAQQQLIGSLTSRFMAELPPEERKGYMLQPRLFLTPQSLADDIMMGDGLTKEQIDARRQRTAFLEKLLSSRSMEELQSTIDANEDQLDDTFFEVLDSWIAQATNSGDAETANALAALRQQLQAVVDPEAAAEDQAALEAERRELLDTLLNERDEDRLRAMVAAARPVLDYYFFLQVADRIEEAQKAGNEIEERRLTNARAGILAMLDELEERDRQALTEATEFLRGALSQANLEEYLRENAARLDDAFFAVLSMNMAEANRRKDENTGRALAGVGAIAAKVVEEAAPPQVRLLNQLLRAQPDERRGMLEQNTELIDKQFVDSVRQMQQVLGRNNAEMSEQLAAVAEMASEFLEGNGSGG